MVKGLHVCETITRTTKERERKHLLVGTILVLEVHDFLVGEVAGHVE